jgi:predicted acylesterase/phospholipase RssA
VKESPLRYPKRANVYRILALDGGGAKGFYTLGVLKQIEALLGGALFNHFDLVYGTSTGAIIAALLVLGSSIDDIYGLYEDHVPTVMRHWYASGRTRALAQLAKSVFGEKNFADVRTGVGIVATRWQLEKPMIFKGDAAQAHGRKATFNPGFGCTIADAIQGSCSAYPYFDRFTIVVDGAPIELIDGGYCANNPTLYAIADAVKALNVAHSDLQVVSVGVGEYPEPKHWVTPKYVAAWIAKHVVGFTSLQLLQKTLNVNTASMEQLRSILFKEIKTVRINDTFQRPEMATDLLEADLNKLKLLYQQGSESFGNHEDDLDKLFKSE